MNEIVWTGGPDEGTERTLRRYINRGYSGTVEIFNYESGVWETTGSKVPSNDVISFLEGTKYRVKFEKPGEEDTMSKEAPATSRVEDTIDSRKSVHGDFTNTARIAQHIKGTIALELRRSGGSCDLPEPVMREGMDMIVSKIARIISGDPYEPDHWLDIAGYASLVEKRIQELREKSDAK